jgi:hypothetical protein
VRDTSCISKRINKENGKKGKVKQKTKKKKNLQDSCQFKILLCGLCIEAQDPINSNYRVRINCRSILYNYIFTNTEQKYMMLLPFERGMFAVSYSDHDVQIAVATRVEPPQNCYITQIPGHTNYAQSVRQPFPSNTGLRFSSEMAVTTI